MEAKFNCILLALLVFHCENSAIVDCALEELTDLPDNFRLESYEVDIHNEMDPEGPYYWGHVIMKVYCIKTTFDIILHGAEFNVGMADFEIWSVSKKVARTVTELNFLSNNRWQIYTSPIIVEQEIYSIKIKFSKYFAADNTGYILQTYSRFEREVSQFFMYTKIKEFGARHIIPCFDQMNIKAKFKMSLSFPRGFKGFSNAQLKPEITSTIGRPDWDTYVFEETEPMAPFSMAIAVLKDFVSMESHLADNVNVQTSAHKLVIHEMGHLHNIMVEIVHFFSSFFESPHPLKKLDVIVLPGVDFEIRQSFGVIFLSETYILNAFNQPTPHAQLDSVSKLCYAVSYQWIGHTVTMSDWTKNWWHHGLNNFLRAKCIRKIHKEFEKSYLELTEIEGFLNFLRSEETAEEYKPIQLLETYPAFHPLVFVTEEKAYYFVQMIHFIMGSDLFRKTLIKYINQFKFKNATMDQAFAVFDDTPAEDMQQPPVKFMSLMSNWMTQKGSINPLIYVIKNRRSKKMILSQQVFNTLMLDEEKPSWIHCHPVPLSYQTKHEQLPEEITPRLWVPCDKTVESVSIHNERDWVVYNLDLNVPGRVMYEQKHWEEIIWSLHDEEEYLLFRLQTRIRLISDMFALAEGGILLYEIVFHAIMYLSHEQEYACWSVAMKEFDRIRSRLLGTSLFPAYMEFMQGFLEPIFEKREFHNLMDHSPGNHLESLFEALILQFSCKFGVEACKEESWRLHKEMERDLRMGVKGNIKMPRAVYKMVLCEHFKTKNDQWIESFWNSYSEGDQPNSNEDFIEAFGCSRNEKTLEMLLQRSIQNHPTISITNRRRILQSVASGDKGYKVMKKFFLNNYATIQSSLLMVLIRPEDCNEIIKLEEELRLPTINSNNAEERNVSFHEYLHNAYSDASHLFYMGILLDSTNREEDFTDLKNFAKKMPIYSWEEALKENIRKAKKNYLWYNRSRESMKTIMDRYNKKYRREKQSKPESSLIMRMDKIKF